MALQNGKWNGLMGALVGKKFDMVLTSLKINAERESVVDFTAPFLGKKSKSASGVFTYFPTRFI